MTGDNAAAPVANAAMPLTLVMRPPFCDWLDKALKELIYGEGNRS